MGYYGTVDVEKTIEFILDQQARSETRWEALREEWKKRDAKWNARQTKIEARQDKTEKQIVPLRAIVKTGMIMMVKVDKRMDELAAAQAETQESLKAFLDSMRRGGNGRH